MTRDRAHPPEEACARARLANPRRDVARVRCGADFFIVAPAGTPADLVARLSDAFKKAVSADNLKRSFAERGATAEFVPTQVLAASIEADVRKWSAIAKGAGAKAE